jgi:mycothiol synthase
MRFRELTEADLPALLDLCQRTLPYDSFNLPLLRRRVWEEPHHTPAYQITAWDGDHLAGAMLGGIRETPEGMGAWIRLFTVDVPYRRQGLGGALLAELEGRLRDAAYKRLRVGNSAPNYLWPGLDVRYTPAFCFLQKHGFERTGEAVNMLVDLHARSWDTSADEERLAAEGFAFRRLTPADGEEFAAWLTQQWNPTWLAEGLSSYANNPISTFVATYQGRICAFASYNVAIFDNGFGPTGTEVALRGRGLGRILFYRCMEDMRQLGHATAEVCWVGPIAFYAKVADAWIHRVFWWMEKSL